MTESIASNPEDPFNDAYYDAVYADAQAMFTLADENYAIAAKFYERGDAMQLVMLVSALALALVAWASLLAEQSKIRVMFGFVGVCMLIYTVVLCGITPAAPIP